MRILRRSLYGQISGLYLVLLFIFCLLCVWIAVRFTTRLYQGAEQNASRDLARTLAAELAPVLRNGPTSSEVRRTVEQFGKINPPLEVYLLDRQGKLLASFVDPDLVERDAVSLGPIRAFLSGREALPILGDYPCDQDGRRVFSVAPVDLGAAGPGYLYLILRGKELQMSVRAFRTNYVLRMMMVNLLFTFLFTGLTGLVLFAFLTRRFRRLSTAVQGFAAGDLDRRVELGGSSEIDRLSAAFNQMADTIQANIEALKQTDRTRRELIAFISHDFRTPLTSMRGYLETVLMRDEALQPEERQRYLRTVLANTDLLSQLVSQLSELSKLDAQQAPPSLETFSIMELVRDVLEKFKPEAERLGFTLYTPPEQDMLFVRGDSGMIERALSNLVDNALQHTPRGGTISVRIVEDRHRVRVSVSDTGQGIPEAEVPLVTRRFYKVNSARTRGAGGSGLGLAIVQRIVDLHDGDLQIESAPGKGTTVSFSLPRGGL